MLVQLRLTPVCRPLSRCKNINQVGTTINSLLTEDLLFFSIEVYLSKIYYLAMTLLDDVLGFQWDKGNIRKNREKHLVSTAECEEIFFNQSLVVADDERFTSTS